MSNAPLVQSKKYWIHHMGLIFVRIRWLLVAPYYPEYFRMYWITGRSQWVAAQSSIGKSKCPHVRQWWMPSIRVGSSTNLTRWKTPFFSKYRVIPAVSLQPPGLSGLSLRNMGARISSLPQRTKKLQTSGKIVNMPLCPVSPLIQVLDAGLRMSGTWTLLFHKTRPFLPHDPSHLGSPVSIAVPFDKLILILSKIDAS